MPHSAQLTTLAAIAIGGALGALARYGVSLGMLAAVPRFAPAGTLVVNVLGCLAIGLLMVLAQAGSISETTRQLLVTGFLGALTTFSTYGWQTVELAREERYLAAAANLLGNVLLGLAAVVVGMWLAKRLIG